MDISIETKLTKLKKQVGPGAAVRFSPLQIALLWTVALLLIVALIFLPDGLLFIGRLLVIISTVYYLIMWIVSVWVVKASVTDGVLQVSAEMAQQDKRTRWPFFSLVVAMYREEQVVSHLVENLNQLHYPHADMEIIFVLEENDTATIEALRRIDLLPHYKVVIRPANHPSRKTKPGAVMYALNVAQAVSPRSQLFGIYDAEDKPDPWQLKKAVLAYERAKEADPAVVCVQGQLAFANGRQNWLTRMSSLDYATHFHLILPGLSKLGLISPLGGTTNFVETPVILALGYDEANVTEDLDLAVKLYLAGFKTRVFSSTTMEEALTDPKAWIAQRSRWQKGALQTYVVHSRRPELFLKRSGVLSWLWFHYTVGGPIITSLINPIFWGMTALYALTGAEFVQALYPGIVFHLAALSFFFGNFTYVYFVLLASMRTGQYGTTLYALFAPAYWALMSLAGYKALIEFLTPKLHTWSKTDHVGFASKSPNTELH